MNPARSWAFGIALVGAAGCFSGDGADTGGGCADCFFESGDYEYSNTEVASDGCGFTIDFDGDWVYVDVDGEDIVFEDSLAGSVTNGHVEAGDSGGFDLSGDGYDCVLDFAVELRGNVVDDGLLEVSTHTVGYSDGGGSDCDEAWSDFGFTTDLPRETEFSYSLTYVD